MEGFYRLNNTVLTFDPIKDIDKIIFNQYIMRKENMQRMKCELPKGQFYLSYTAAEIDLNMSREKIRRLVKLFIKLEIISIIKVFPSGMKKPSIYEYLIKVSTYENDKKSDTVDNTVNNTVDDTVKQRISNSFFTTSDTVYNTVNNTVSDTSKKELLKRNIKKNTKKENNTSSSSDDGNGDISSNNSKKELQDQIESLWSMYPNKKGKATAIKKLPKLIHQYGYEQIERCIERYKQEVEAKGTPREYIKYGSTFFNGGYMDYLDENYQEEQKKGAEVDGYDENGDYSSGEFYERIRKHNERLENERRAHIEFDERQRAKANQYKGMSDEELAEYARKLTEDL